MTHPYYKKNTSEKIYILKKCFITPPEMLMSEKGKTKFNSNQKIDCIKRVTNSEAK